MEQRRPSLSIQPPLSTFNRKDSERRSHQYAAGSGVGAVRDRVCSRTAPRDSPANQKPRGETLDWVEMGAKGGGGDWGETERRREGGHRCE